MNLFNTLAMVGFVGVGMVFGSPTLNAGGSLGLSEIEPLLQQQPQLWKFYQDNFEIPSMIWGKRLGGRTDFPLYGERVGSYSMEVTEKKTGMQYGLVIETDTFFLDAKGNQVEGKGYPAVQIKEILRGITLTPKDYVPDPQPVFIRKAPDFPSTPSPSPK
jgi:hypothetical protein